MSGPQVYFTTPHFKLIPDPLPAALPPPIKERSFRAPFGIDPWLFNFALKPEIPITFATLYIITVLSLNAYNKSRNHKPWWIARQRLFRWFIIIHNAVLTLYSAATFLAMCRAIVHTWPGIDTSNGLAGVADALCKIHGPRGLGDATAYNTTINIWEAKNTIIKLGYDGNPDPTDVGRLWNEGLAFWGWMFYVSKFYEVLDTLIILAKGKRSATLQTYHHSGAMLCMWAGIRYMSPPIWMFVFVNSFIHALMYTYFTLSAAGFRVPVIVKRTLTSMQISQFVWGASYAAAHLFIQYDIPISSPYRVAATVQSAISQVSSAAAAATSTVSEVIESPATSDAFIALLKKILLRAVGEEGIAERISNGNFQPGSLQIEQNLRQFEERTIPKAQQKVQQLFETRWRTEWTKTNCIDTSGEAFAIYLNLLYLAPLTLLFVRFFYRTYFGRSRARRASQVAQQVFGSAKAAKDRTSEAVEKVGSRAEDEIIRAEAELQKVDVKDIHEQLRRDVQAMKSGTWGRDNRRVSDHVQNFERQVRSAAESVKEQGRRVASGTSSPRRASPSKRQVDIAREESSSFAEGDIKTMSSSTVIQASSESEQKQEENLMASESTRPGGGTEAQFMETVTAVVPEAGRLDGLTYSQVVQESSTSNNMSDFSQTSTSHSESYSFSQSQETRTESHSESHGDSVFGFGDEDSDEMGRSGAIVDYVSEKAEDAKKEAEEALSDEV